MIALLIDKSRKHKKCPTGLGLQAIRELLQIAFASSAENLREKVNRCYKIYITEEPQKPSSSKSKQVHDKSLKVVNFWCFSAGFGYFFSHIFQFNLRLVLEMALINCIICIIFFFRMQYLQQQNIRCLILTSGTLTPLQPLASEMEISLPIELSNPHIIDESQVFVRIVDTGPNQINLDSSFKNRFILMRIWFFFSMQL